MLVFNCNITVNRNGETGRTYVVPTTDSSYGGIYTCLVSISSGTSEESIGVVITVMRGMHTLLTLAKHMEAGGPERNVS